jgi:uncharacterized protein (TIGR03437 family)
MKSLVCCVVVCALFAPVPVVSDTPIVLFANFNPGDELGSSGHVVGGADEWTVAAAFTPSVTASLASIELAALNLNDRNASSKSFEIDVCVDSSGEPDCAVPLDSLTVTGLTNDTQVFSVDSAARALLTADTPYWLVVSVPNPPIDKVRWIRVEDRKGDNARRSGGGPWQVAIEELALAFRILGQSDTPFVSEGSVLNVASYALPGVPFHGLAQGSMFVVFGNTLGPDALQMSSLPRPTELAGTSVQVTVGGVTVDAFLVYTSANQLAAILPSSTPTGDGTLTVTYDGNSGDPVSVHVVRSAPGIFTWNQAGFGPGIIQNWVSPTSAPTNSLIEAAAPGQTEILWATGLGPIAEPDNELPPVGDLPLDVTVLVGNQRVTPAYAGRSPQFPAIDQVNFEFPAGVEGCRVPVALMVDDVISNYVTMSAAVSGSTCSDPTDFMSADLEKVLQNRGGNIGVIGLMRGRGKFVTPGGEVPVHMDQIRASFYQRNLTQILSAPGLRENDLQPTVPSLGTCVASSFPSGEMVFHPTDPVPLFPLDTGPELTITSPSAEARQVPSAIAGIYGAPLGGGSPGGEVAPDYLEAGRYTVSNGQGGSVIGPFDASVDILLPPNWTNEASISQVSRSQDLTITWVPGDPGKESLVILGASDNLATDTTTGFVCNAPIDSGTFTVPSTVLLSISPNTPWTFEGSPTGVLFVGAVPVGNGVKFEAPGIDIGYFHYANWVFKNVDFQ